MGATDPKVDADRFRCGRAPSLPYALGVLLISAVSLVAIPAPAQQSSGDRDGTASATERSEQKASEDDHALDTPDGTSRSGVQTFDDVTVERIRPGELPPRQKTSLPDVLRPAQQGKSAQAALPTPPNADELRRTSEDVAPRVWSVVAVDRPDDSLQSSPTLFRGHAVAIGAGPPLLMTSYAWLKPADEVYLVRPKPSGTDSEQDARSVPTAHTIDMDEATLAAQSDEWLEKHRDRLVQIDLFKPDKHRNLVTLVPRDVSALALPNNGLDLFAIDGKSPTRLYGHSPYASESSLQMATLSPNAPDDRALSFYLQTTWRPAHGAPLVSSDGKLVTVTAMQHPDEHGEPTTLVIPPTPLRSYIDEVRDAASQ